MLGDLRSEEAPLSAEIDEFVVVGVLGTSGMTVNFAILVRMRHVFSKGMTMATSPVVRSFNSSRERPG